MNKRIRILCLILALVMVLPMLFACGDGEEEETKKPTGPAISNKEDPLAEFAKDLDFGGEEIVINLSKYTNDQITTESLQFIQGPDKTTTDTVLNKIYNRNNHVSDSIGVEARYVYTNLAYNQIMPDIQQKVVTPGKDTPDLYIDQLYGISRAQMAGYLLNVLSEHETSHINFDEGGWYNDYMKAFNLHSDEKLYLLAGDYTMDVIRFLNLMSCNLSLFQELFYKDGGDDLLYDAVTDGEWSYDLLMEWSEVAYRDTPGTDPGPDKNDQLGLFTSYHGGQGPIAMGWLPSANVSLFDVSAQGKFSVPATHERAFNVIEKLIKVLHHTTGVYVPQGTDADSATTDARTAFVNGTSLFTTGVLLYMMETSEYQNMEDEKCVLPYPKYDPKTDDYYVTTHDCARVGGVLKVTQKFEETSAWLQAMALTSTDVLDEYYNAALKFKYGSNADTTKILDIIYDSICAPYWYAPINDASTNFTSPLDSFTALGSETNNFTSNYASVKGILQSNLEDYVSRFNALQDQ